MERFDADAIVEALERLDIRKGNVAVTAKITPSSVGPLDQFEPVYGNRICVESFHQPPPRDDCLSRYRGLHVLGNLRGILGSKGNVAVTAKITPSSVGPLDQFEPVYGTRYRKDQMPRPTSSTSNWTTSKFPGMNRLGPGKNSSWSEPPFSAAMISVSPRVREVLSDAPSANRTPHCLAGHHRLKTMAQTRRHILGAESQCIHRPPIVCSVLRRWNLETNQKIVEQSSPCWQRRPAWACE
jgi:hypothetical protein